MAISAGVAALTVAAGTSIYSAINSNQQAQHAKGAAQAQAQQAQTAAAEQQATINQNETTAAANNARNQAEQRQSQIVGAAQGVGSTILTSGLGVLSSPQTGSNQLLGK
jgi:hypothetical protein